MNHRLQLRFCTLLLGVFWAGISARGGAAQEPSSAPATTGWVCGVVLDETAALVSEADITVAPRSNGAEPGADEPEPIAHETSDSHGAFCVRDLAPSFYTLRVVKSPWPMQPPRTVEARAGLMNRLDPIELELEPGEPRVSYAESFDGMSAGQARALVERLLVAGDPASIREVARRLLPKRGVRTDVGRLIWGFDPKPLCDELIRELERGVLPPVKTARYLYAIGDLADKRTLDAAVTLLLAKLRDGRRLPANAASGESSTSYVSDIAAQALSRVASKDFKWKFGLPPLQNQSAIASAQGWWTSELERRQRDKEP